MRSPQIITAIALCTSVALTGCTSGNDSSDESDSGDSLKTDVGVTADEIKLAVMTDMSGPYKSGGLALAAGNEIWADEINDDGGICGRDIALDMHDTTYKVDLAVPQYETVRANDLGIVQLGGSHILAALKEKMTADQLLTTPAGWASVGLDRPEILLIGTTYDIEIINGLAYLQKEGLIADGDKIGHIYVDAEYGQNGLLGSKAYAAEHSLTIVEAPISTSDTDMTATITKMKSEGVKAVLLSVTPAATGSVALQNVAQGLNVPLLGNNQSFAPTLLTDDSVTAALAFQYSMVSSGAPFTYDDNETSTTLAKAYTDKTEDAPSAGVVLGYLMGLAWGAILEEACDAGDMTRAGVLAAKSKVTDLDTKGLMGTLDFTTEGAPATRETFILKVDKAVPGGLKVAEELSASSEAEAYKAPFEQ